MKKSWIVGGLVAAAVATTWACSSSNSLVPSQYQSCWLFSGSNADPNTNTNTACGSCMQSNCDSQINDFFGSGGCGPYVSCACSAGSATATASQCSSQSESSACTSAETAIGSCQQQHCNSQCTTTSSGSGGGSGSSSGSSVTLSAICQAYETCCVNAYDSLDAGSSLAASCPGVAQTLQQSGGDSSCSAAMAELVDAGITGCQ